MHGWWQKFLKRNPSLSLQAGDSTAGVRMDAINAENITNYFDLLKEALQQAKQREKETLQQAKQREKKTLQQAKQQEKARQSEARGNKRRVDGISTSRPKRKKSTKNIDNEIDNNRCWTCFGVYSDRNNSNFDGITIN